MVSPAGAPTPTRIALTGLASSHADEVVRYLNVAGRQGPARVVALVGAQGERAQELSRQGGIDVVVAAPGDLDGRVDAAIICERDGSAHPALATAFLDQGIPVFVDKPFTADAKDARALVERARVRGVQLTSCSALRFAPEVVALSARLQRTAGPRRVEVSGSVDPWSPHDGVHYYGSHLTDIGASLVRGAPRDVEVDEDGAGGFVVTARMGEDELVLHLAAPSAAAPFAVAGRSAAASGGDEPTRLVLGEDYFWPAMDAFFAGVRTGTTVVPAREMIRSVELLDAIAERLPRRPVSAVGAG